MKFFRKPLVGTVRKRFVWFPKRTSWVEYGHRAIPNAELLDFYPGWSDHGLMSFGSNTNWAPGFRPASIPQGCCGGKVMPAESLAEVTDEWVWFDWVLEQVAIENHHSAPVARWRYTPIPRQWNLFHEYY